jgi:hypothetical protein
MPGSGMKVSGSLLRTKLMIVPLVQSNGCGGAMNRRGEPRGFASCCLVVFQ